MSYVKMAGNYFDDVGALVAAGQHFSGSSAVNHEDFFRLAIVQATSAFESTCKEYFLQNFVACLLENAQVGELGKDKHMHFTVGEVYELLSCTSLHERQQCLRAMVRVKFERRSFASVEKVAESMSCLGKKKDWDRWRKNNKDVVGSAEATFARRHAIAHVGERSLSCSGERPSLTLEETQRHIDALRNMVSLFDEVGNISIVPSQHAR